MRRGIVLTSAVIFVCAGDLALGAAPTAVDWKAMLPAVRSVVRQAFPKEAAQAHYPPSISRTADVTGTGQSEALVDLGSGAYTEEMTVVRMEGEKPVVARFRGKDDTVAPMLFLDGLSEGKGEAVKLLPQEHVIYSGHWTVDGTKVKHCGGEAYEWDASAKNFGFSKKMSKELTKEFCQKVGPQPINH